MKSFLTTLLLLTVPFVATAQLISNPYPPVPAAMAVGGAYTAAATGAEAPYWNPAGLAFGKGTEGRFSYQQPWSMVGISHLSAAGFTVLPRKLGGLGLGVQTLGTRSDGHTMAAETEAYLAHGLLLQKDIHSSLAFGYALKLINYDLGQSVADAQGTSLNLGSASAFGLDVGATAQLWDRFWLGGSFKNINQPQFGAGIKRDLPRMLSGGLSYAPYYGVRTTFDVERVVNGETQFKGGINANVIKPLDLRFGVMSNPNSFTAGFGLHWRELVIDYAFIYHSVLNPSHLVSIGFNLGQSLQEVWDAKGSAKQLHHEVNPPPPAPTAATPPPPPPAPTATPQVVMEVPPPQPVDSVKAPAAPDTAGTAARLQAQTEADRAKIQPIYFGTGKSALTAAETAKVRTSADILKKYPAWKVTLVGHTDARGNKTYNLSLAKRRAEVVKKALVALGVDTARISTLSVADEQPAERGTAETALAKNRRVEFQIQ